jgi:hypothetical protein
MMGIGGAPYNRMVKNIDPSLRFKELGLCDPSPELGARVFG